MPDDTMHPDARATIQRAWERVSARAGLPATDLETGARVSLLAYARWRHPLRGDIQPKDFRGLRCFFRSQFGSSPGAKFPPGKVYHPRLFPMSLLH